MSIDNSGDEFSIDNWGDKFPRLYNLQQFARTEGKPGLSCLPDALLSPPARVYFEHIESDLAELDQDAWRIFLNRLKPLSVQSDATRRALIDHLHEAKGYRFLKKEGFSKIDFIPEEQQPTPDLSATLGDTIVALLEVKTVWQSNNQKERVKKNTRNMKCGKSPTVQRLVPSFPDRLKDPKLKQNLEDAENRQLLDYLASAKCRQVVYFVIFLDFAQQTTPDITKAIETYLPEHLAPRKARASRSYAMSRTISLSPPGKRGGGDTVY